MKLITVHDARAEMYFSPSTQPSRGHAIRSFADSANDRESPIGKHPEDYYLVELGTWNDRTGVIELHSVPEVLSSAIDLVAHD
jgi:hypothetical protein